MQVWSRYNWEKESVLNNTSHLLNVCALLHTYVCTSGVGDVIITRLLTQNW